MHNVFNVADTAAFVARINQLTDKSKAVWRKMGVAQMLAHCNVTYEMVYENIHPKPNPIKRFLLTTFVKPLVVTEKPYKKSSQTAPEFIIKSDKNFDQEKARLIAYLERTQQLGAQHFHNKASLSFGNLSSTEWNNLFAKHLDHHLQQFGA